MHLPYTAKALQAALTDLRRAHRTHAWTRPGLQRSTKNAVDCWRLSKPKVEAWTSEENVLITQRKDSGSRQGQRSYFAFFQFRARLRSVFARLSGRCRSRLYTFSPPYHFRDNHPTSETITQKFLFLGQFLLDFDKRPLDRKLSTSGCLKQNKKWIGATVTELLRSKVAGTWKDWKTPRPSHHRPSTLYFLCGPYRRGLTLVC